MKFLARLLTLLFLAPLASHATSITWTNTGGGDWNIPANWNPHQVPGSNDVAVITAGGFNVVVSATNFTLGLTLYNTSSLTVLSNGVLNILGNSTFYGPLTNAGTVNWQRGTLSATYLVPNYLGAIWNNAGGAFEIQCDQTFTVSDTGGGGFQNVGILRKSVTTGTTSLPMAITNSGTIEAATGTLQLAGGGSLGGTLLADAGAALYLSGNFQSVYVMSNALCSGSGLLGAQGSPALSGSFAGSFNLYNNAVMGASGSAFTVPTNGVLNIVGSHAAFDGPFTNQGTVNWQAGTLNIDNNGGAITGEIWNGPGALWDIKCDQSTAVTFGLNLERFHNLGLLRKDVTTGTTTFKFNFDNQGTIQLQSGLIEFTNTYSSTSTANLSIAISGLMPGTNFGRVQLDLAPALSGTFTVVMTNGYRPNPGDSFQVLSYPSATGDFTSLNGLDLAGGLRLEPHFNPQGLTLVAATYATNAAPVLSLFHANSGMLVSWPVEFNGWQLYSTPDLANPNWTPVTVSGQNNTILSNVQQQFFRLQSSQ